MVKNTLARWIAAPLLFLTVLSLSPCSKEKVIPPAPQVTINANQEEFYKAFVKSLDYITKAKMAFHQGQEWMKGVPESLPETTSTENLPQSPIFKAATQFAFALEQFKYAEDLIDSDNGGPVNGPLIECRRQFKEALEKYQSTAKLYNEHAKAKYQEDDDKSERFALSDANARWALAEKLMSDFIVQGCGGDLFLYLKKQAPEMRSAVLAQCQQVLGDSYATHRMTLEALLGVTAGGGASPSPSQVPIP